MITSSWPAGVNTNFFSMSKKPKDNTIKTSYNSGRNTAHRINTKTLFEYSAKIRLEYDTEGAAFWAWYNDTLGQQAGYFTCSKLGAGTFQFTATPEPEDTDRAFLTLSLEFEEV